MQKCVSLHTPHALCRKVQPVTKTSVELCEGAEEISRKCTKTYDVAILETLPHRHAYKFHQKNCHRPFANT